MRLVAYLRVSTEEQEASGLGLEAQRHNIAAYADLYGHTVVDYHMDICSGSTPHTERIGWAAVRTALTFKKADGVVFLRLDRVGRSVSDIAAIVDSLDKSHHFISVKEQFDTNSPAGKMMLHILAAVAQFERDCIRARTVEAMAAKKIRGEQVGRAPIISRAAAELAQQLYYHDETKYTWADVADILAQQGHVNTGDKRPFHPVTIQRAVGRLSSLQKGDIELEAKIGRSK